MLQHRSRHLIREKWLPKICDVAEQVSYHGLKHRLSSRGQPPELESKAGSDDIPRSSSGVTSVARMDNPAFAIGVLSLAKIKPPSQIMNDRRLVTDWKDAAIRLYDRLYGSRCPKCFKHIDKTQDSEMYEMSAGLVLVHKVCPA